MALIQTVHLSMANFKSAPVVPAVQNDTDRQVKMIIDDYTLTSGLTGKIAFERSDGTHYETAAELVLADNAFTADIDQALTQPGRTMVQLKVTDTLTVSSFSFVIFVEADNSGTVTPQEGIDLVTAVAAAEDAADRAESAAESLELDATLTSPTKAAQAKAVGDAIGEIEENVNDLTDSLASVLSIEEIENSVVEGYFNSTTLQYWNQSRNVIVYIPCEPHKNYKITKDVDTQAFAISYIKSVPATGVQQPVYNYKSFNVTETSVDYFTGDDALYILILVGVGTVDSIVGHVQTGIYVVDDLNQLEERVSVLESDTSIESIESSIESIESVIEVVTYKDEEITNITPTFTVGAISEIGLSIPSYTSFNYSQKIAVNPGDVINAIKSNSGLSHMRWVCAYNGNTVISASGSNADDSTYTVPEGIDGIIITVRIADDVTAIRITREVEKLASYVKPIPMGFMTEKGSLNDGNDLTLPSHNVKNNNIYIFNANITSLDSIKFSKQSDTYLIVDDTNISITNGQDNPVIPHGLTIGSNISLIVENEESTYTSLIRLSSDGVEFSYTTPIRFLMDTGAPKITSIGSVLTDCVFSWVSKNVNAPIWMFGDSYFSWYDVRWTYYAARDNFLKCSMLNAYAGQASGTAYTSLLHLLEITTPKIVVWCLGMNDGDTSSAVNVSWYSYYLKLVELQKKHGFELVLYTTPTTPTINNNYKNEIIRNSGYRYIEADLAVRIDSEGHWVTGALDVDNVHPTAIGAKILYYRFLADLPEMMCNY